MEERKNLCKRERSIVIWAMDIS